jgi:hypothetical protein
LPSRRFVLCSAVMSGEGAEQSALEFEAELLGRYLVGCPPPPKLVARYGEAERAIWKAPAPAAEASLVAFVRRHPWSIGFLDAAAALLQPSGRLRGKVLVMSAVLETSPTFADEFLPRTKPRGSLVLHVAAAGAVAAAQAVLGLALYPIAVRTRA